LAKIPTELRQGVSPTLRRLEEVSLNSSATPRQLLYDGWIVRLSPGKAKRARSINPFFPSRLALDDKLAVCAERYREHRLPMLVRVTPFVSPTDLDDHLYARGFLPSEETRVMTVELAEHARTTEPPPHPVESCDLETVIAAVSALRGAQPQQIAAHGERLRMLPLAIQGFVIRHGGAALCAGLVIVELPWAGIFDVVTAEAHRGRGLASALTDAMLDWSRGHGASAAYLQVEAENRPARAVYLAHGFVDRYAYWYRAPPGS
jgi:GNAT superfamily N-acetyltransferase